MAQRLHGGAEMRRRRGSFIATGFGRAPICLALGVASFGHIGGTHYQNQHDFEPYVKPSQSGQLPICRASRRRRTNDSSGSSFCNSSWAMSAGIFREEIWHRSAARFAAPIQTLKDWGFLTVEGDSVLSEPRRIAAGGSAVARVFPAGTSKYALCLIVYTSSICPGGSCLLFIRWMIFTRQPECHFRRSRRIEGARVPEPYRGLLVHEKDMTPTLEAFHGGDIHLRILSSDYAW